MIGLLRYADTCGHMRDGPCEKMAGHCCRLERKDGRTHRHSKGPARKKENLYIFSSREGRGPHWTSFFYKLLLNGASNDTKMGCIRLFWAGAKK